MVARVRVEIEPVRQQDQDNALFAATASAKPSTMSGLIWLRGKSRIEDRFMEWMNALFAASASIKTAHNERLIWLRGEVEIEDRLPARSG